MRGRLCSARGEIAWDGKLVLQKDIPGAALARRSFLPSPVTFMPSVDSLAAGRQQ